MSRTIDVFTQDFYLIYLIYFDIFINIYIGDNFYTNITNLLLLLFYF